MSILLGILTFILILVSLFLVLVVLMQKSKDGGIGAALGGGAAEAAFGADTTNVLSKSTIVGLYLGRIYEAKHALGGSGGALPTISAPASAAVPVTPVDGSTAVPAPAVTLPATPAATDAPAPTAPAPATKQ
jgi:preprotein translocase subunit SecG